MCEGVLAAVERRAEGRPVRRIRVRAGAALRVVPEAFAMAFEMVALGSVAEDATAEVVVVPLAATCRGCGTAFETEEPVPACPACGSVALDREKSAELVLESVEYANVREGV
jgi:hydrogenase nickel incorporation protein HypA/HybF